jgi:hypothetical protein
MKCAVCNCDVTEPYGHLLGKGSVTCWFCADYYYIVHPERFAAAQLKHRDIPNILNLEESGSMRKWANV